MDYGPIASPCASDRAEACSVFRHLLARGRSRTLRAVPKGTPWADLVHRRPPPRGGKLEAGEPEGRRDDTRNQGPGAERGGALPAAARHQKLQRHSSSASTRCQWLTSPAASRNRIAVPAPRDPSSGWSRQVSRKCPPSGCASRPSARTTSAAGAAVSRRFMP